MFFDRFEDLCKQKGVSKQRACIDCGLSRTAWNKWKAGAIPNGDAVQSLADYFGVTTDYLLTGEETKKAPTQDGERGIDEQNLKVAFFRGADPTLTKEDMDAMWEDARAFRDFIVAKRKREKEKNGG